MELKRRIIENIDEVNGNDYENVDDVWLEKMVEFCQDHLAIQETVEPGLTPYRAYLSFHIAEPWYWLTKKRYLNHSCGKEELQDSMEIIASHLDTVIKTWGRYRQGSTQRLQADIATDLLHLVQKDLSQIK